MSGASSAGRGCGRSILPCPTEIGHIKGTFWGEREANKTERDGGLDVLVQFGLALATPVVHQEKSKLVTRSLCHFSPAPE